MRKWTALLLITPTLLCSTIARADSWFEAQASFFETIDGKFAPAMSMQIVNYIDDKGVGVFLGQDAAAGPALSWRVFEQWWTPAWGNAVHLAANSDLWQGKSEKRIPNATYQLDVRWFWSALNGKLELSTPVQAEFREGEQYEWTFGIQFVFTPGKALKGK